MKTVSFFQRKLFELKTGEGNPHGRLIKVMFALTGIIRGCLIIFLKYNNQPTKPYLTGPGWFCTPSSPHLLYER